MAPAIGRVVVAWKRHDITVDIRIRVTRRPDTAVVKAAERVTRIPLLGPVIGAPAAVVWVSVEETSE